jgi:Fe-S oxidoreductase
MYAVRSGLQKFDIEHNFEIESIIRLYARWIREGRLPVSAEWNKDLGVTFTVQDPCQLVRKSFGDPVAEDLRFVVRSVVGDENFIDMVPKGSNNYCCGGGGGFLQSGYTSERRAYGARKLRQILDTGADYCIAPCHNCHSQIHDLSEHSGHHFPVVHLWTLICLAMGKLGENERGYLGEDLVRVGLE